MIQKAVIQADNNWTVKTIREFDGSPVRRIARDWMLITAGDTASNAGNWNTMTASWGGFGELWGKDVAFMFIRPGRHTRGFADSASLFTLSFFDEKYRTALAFCGEKSGRDYDKAAETGLTPIVFDSALANGKAAGAVAFREASDIVVCRKIYAHDFDPAKFLDLSILSNYPNSDWHRMYIGEIQTLLSSK